MKSGRIWLARAIVSIVLSVFGLRRSRRKIKNKICLSFYVTDNSLDLSNVAIKQPDIYLAYWLEQLIPVYDPNNLRKELLKQNAWVKSYLKRFGNDYDLFSNWKVKDSDWSNKIKSLGEAFWGKGYGNLIENQAKGMQKARMKMNVSSVQNEKDTRVVVNDNMLKFHENDKREEFKKTWLLKCNQLGL